MHQALTQWLEAIGVVHQSVVFHNPNRSVLITESIHNKEGMLTDSGTLGVVTTPYTGRSPYDKYIVDYGNNSKMWWGDVNQRISPENFNHLINRITAYFNNRKFYVIDCFIGADINYRQSIRVVTEYAWQALVCQNLFIYNDTIIKDDPDIVIFVAPEFRTQPLVDHVNSNTAICLDLQNKMILIAGTKYAGEIKKSAFTIMNGILPEVDVLPMHCSANVGEKGDVALFFGLSGTGKTTLSSTSRRQLIGDDEHGWSDQGIFNFEGGCYAKTIRLDPKLEPVTWKATNQYGSVLENVVIDPDTRIPDYDDSKNTENTRTVYPLAYIKNASHTGLAGHPTNIIFLTADAFGVMPPIAKLDPEQAQYYFLSGYTSKIAGTERGLGQKPIATFSTCFAEPFLLFFPEIYARLLQRKITEHKCNIWLLNTGWTGGDFKSGYRMPLKSTRKMVDFILAEDHRDINFHKDSVFELSVPDKISGIQNDLLYPIKTWQDSKEFQRTAENLKADFDENFENFSSLLLNAYS